MGGVLVSHQLCSPCFAIGRERFSPVLASSLSHNIRREIETWSELGTVRLQIFYKLVTDVQFATTLNYFNPPQNRNKHFCLFLSNLLQTFRIKPHFLTCMSFSLA